MLFSSLCPGTEAFPGWREVGAGAYYFTGSCLKSCSFVKWNSEEVPILTSQHRLTPELYQCHAKLWRGVRDIGVVAAADTQHVRFIRVSEKASFCCGLFGWRKLPIPTAILRQRGSHWRLTTRASQWTGGKILRWSCEISSMRPAWGLSFIVI